MRYHVLGKRGLLGILLAFCLCTAAAVTVANRVGAAIFVDGTPRKLPIYSVETEEKQVSLGFNCAWGNEDVPLLAATLKEHHAEATFFVVGQWAEQYPESVKELYDAGFEIGNHSYSHPDMTKLSKEEMADQIQRCGDVVERITGERPKLFRAPSGAYNNLVVETAESLGYTAVQWSFDSRDWQGPTAAEIVSRLEKDLEPGTIMLFHVGKENTDEAMPEILRLLEEKGYRAVKTSALLLPGEWEVDVQGRQHPRAPT